MNREQHARARAVIEAAVFLCEGFLATDKPRYCATPVPERGFVCCAMGELLVAAGYQYEELGEDPDNWTQAYPRLIDVYGLGNGECEAIVRANEDPIHTLGHEAAQEFGNEHDGYDYAPARKAAVLATLDRLVWT